MLFNNIRRAVRVLRGHEPSETKEISNEHLRAFLNKETLPAAPLGDGKAEFLGEGTHEEFVDQEREDKGTKSGTTAFCVDKRYEL